MGHNATIRPLALLLAGAAMLLAQNPEWRRAGTGVVELGLASPAGGPVERVWYSADGARLYARTASGRVFETTDFETWQAALNVTAPAAADYARTATRPEPGAQARAAGESASARLYAFGGAALYRSQDEGRSWRNVSHNRGESILGGGFADLAVSPRDADEIVAANGAGVWRSLDGGLSWSGLNEALPNLPVRRLYQAGARLRIALQGGAEAVWQPGQRDAWVPAQSADFTRRDLAARNTLSAAVGARVTALATAGDYVYAGSQGGRIWSSADRGGVWRAQTLGDTGAPDAVFSSIEEPRVAVAAMNGRVFRTFNGGLFWDDITANLAAGAVHGVTADIASGAVYAAGDAGVFVFYLDLRGAAAPGTWTRLAGLPGGAAAWDVQLGEGGHQIFVALDGPGVYAALAPHRLRDPRVVNAADHSMRAAAPGTLLSVMGAAISSARTGNLEAPVLGASGGESQIQIPFEVGGASQLSLALTTAGTGARREVQLALAAAAPAIFLDRDGSPMLLDADRGVLLEPGVAVRAGSRLQILATGLGRVTPEWPTGTPAPAANPPRVIAPVSVYVDRTPVEVTRATLAPGFVGFYLLEIVLPDAVNNGPAELYIEAAGQPSGRVSILLLQ